MRLSDAITLAFTNLWRRKVRSSLNLIGVVTGCTMLMMAVAGGNGVRRAFQDLFESSEFVRQIQIRKAPESVEIPEGEIVVQGNMAQDRYQRVKKMLEREWHARNGGTSRQEMSVDDLRQVADFNHVEEIVPNSWVNGVLNSQRKSALCSLEVASTIGTLEERLTCGTLPTGPGEALIDDVTAYRLGYLDDEDLESLLGQELEFVVETQRRSGFNVYRALGEGEAYDAEFVTRQLELLEAINALVADIDSTSLTEKQKEVIRSAIATRMDGEKEVRQDQPTAIKRSFRICGIYQPESPKDLWSIFRQFAMGDTHAILVHSSAYLDIAEESGRDDFYSAVINVDSYRSLRDVSESSQAMDLRTSSALETMERVDRDIHQVVLAVYGLSALVLVTTCIGIANTLLVSVIARTREFGILKAIGARDWHIGRLMLVEGGLLGFCGGVLSVFLSVFLAWLGQAWLSNYVESRVNQEFESQLFYFHPVAIASVVALATTVCISASVAPAWRSFRLSPVDAMRDTV